MKLRFKYTLITMSAGIIGSLLMIMFITGRVDIWNLPKHYTVFIIALVSFLLLYLGGFMLYIENTALPEKECKIGEVFEFNGTWLRVEEDTCGDCWYCKFDDEIYGCMKPLDLKQYCNRKDRKDKKNVVFVEKDRLRV